MRSRSTGIGQRGYVAVLARNGKRRLARRVVPPFVVGCGWHQAAAPREGFLEQRRPRHRAGSWHIVHTYALGGARGGDLPRLLPDSAQLLHPSPDQTRRRPIAFQRRARPLIQIKVGQRVLDHFNSHEVESPEAGLLEVAGQKGLDGRSSLPRASAPGCDETGRYWIRHVGRRRRTGNT
jgi:hypothetical protein